MPASISRVAVAATNNVTKLFGALEENQLGPFRVRWSGSAGEAAKNPSTTETRGAGQAVGFISSGLFNLKEDEGPGDDAEDAGQPSTSASTPTGRIWSRQNTSMAPAA